MNDPLDDLQAYLAKEGYENIFIDGFVVLPKEDERNYNQINIQSEPSSTDIEVGFRTISWSIFIKNRDKESAKSLSKSIRNILLNYGGKLVDDIESVTFKKIWVATEPYFWGVSQNNENIYLTRYQAVIVDKDIRTVYDD